MVNFVQETVDIAMLSYQNHPKNAMTTQKITKHSCNLKPFTNRVLQKFMLYIEMTVEKRWNK